jgi:ABC-type multidrug transport system fused ATPase/permease subunit
MGAGLCLCWIARFVLASVSQYLAGTTALRVLSDLRARIFAHVQRLGVRYFDRAKAGRIVSRVDRDVDSLEPLLIQGPPELLSALLRCLVSGTLIFRLSPQLFLALVWIVPVLAPAVLVFQRIASRNCGRIAERRSRFTAHLVESVAAVRIIKQTVQEAPNRLRYARPSGRRSAGCVPRRTSAAWLLPRKQPRHAKGRNCQIPPSWMSGTRRALAANQRKC